MKKQLLSIFLVFCMLVAFVPVTNLTIMATTEDTTITLSPGYVEFWVNFGSECRLKTTVTGDNPNQTVQYHTSDKGIVLIESDGNLVPVAPGTARVWATATDGSGAKSNEVTVRVLPEVVYGEDQQLTLGSTSASRINISEYTAWPAEYGDAHVALWANNANGAFTLTVDDNIMGDFAKWNKWLDTYGIPVTFIAPTSCVYEAGNYWLAEVALGQGVQSHTRCHRSDTESKACTSAQVWMDFYQGYLDIAQVTDSLTVGYSYGWNSAEYSSKIYIAGRGTHGSSNAADKVNYNQINSYSGYGSTAQSSMESLIAGNSVGTWISVHQHAIVSSNDDTAKLDALLALLEQNQDKVWADTFTHVAQYGQERDTSTLTVDSHDANTVYFTLTDKMSDAHFNYPLTVKIKVDSTWENVRAYQNGVAVDAEIVTNDSGTFAMVQAVPDRGQVTVIRTGSSLTVGADTVQFNPTDFVNGTLPTTYIQTVPVDKTWVRVIATQNGVKVPATVETVGSSTYVNVTVKAGGGEVTVTRVPSAVDLDAVDHLTMTQVYYNEADVTGELPITVSSAKELEMLAEYVSASFHDCKGLTFRLTRDIDMTGVTHTPIGWRDDRGAAVQFFHPFAGTFDGNGYRIYNLEINSQVKSSSLFGYLTGTVKNLDVAGNISGVEEVGGIAGVTGIGASIESCSFTGTITVGIPTGAEDSIKNPACYVGGLVGYNSGCNISASTVSAAITVTAGTGAGTGSFVGGIAGVSYGKSVIDNCAFSGSVTVNTPNGTGGKCVAGILGGGNTYTVRNCYANGDICGGTYVGGITGDLLAGGSAYAVSVKNCAAVGSVSGKSYAGGITGRTGHVGYLDNVFSAVRVTCLGDDPTTVGAVIGVKGGANTSLGYLYYLESVNPGMAGIGSHESGAKAASAAPVTDAHLDGTATENIGTATYSKYPTLLTALNAYATANADTCKTWAVPDGAIYPSPLSLPTFTVTYLAKDGTTILQTQTVSKGLDAVPPAAPVVPGYAFSHWAGDLTSIRRDTTVQAVYDEAWTVDFYAEDGVTLLNTVYVKKGGSAEALAPEAPAVRGYAFTGWSADITAVNADMSVTAQYRALGSHTVIFYGQDDTVLDRQELFEGEDATAPDVPNVPGYRFNGWDTDFTNVQSNLSVKAVYIKTWTVTFYESDGTTVIGEPQTVDNGAAAVAPVPTVGEGYVFERWDTDFTGVTGDLEVVAVLRRLDQYTVTFLGKDGETLKTEQVWEGSDAVAPEAPAVNGYRFLGWSPETFTDIQSDLTVRAQYEQLALYTVTFLDRDGNVLTKVTVEEGTAATAAFPLVDGYRFTGWSENLSGVNGNMTVRAQYEIYDGSAVYGGTPATSLLGEGTQENPYVIYTPEEFMYFRNTVAAGATAETYAVLGADIRLNAEGSKQNSLTAPQNFAGHLDGRGYTVYYPYYNGAGTGMALFATVSGTLRNLTAYGAEILAGGNGIQAATFALTCSGSILNCHSLKADIRAGAEAGGIAAKMTAGRIEGCTVSGSICTGNGVTRTYGEPAGGIVGLVSIEKENDIVYITDSVNYATVGNTEKDNFAGGIAGKLNRGKAEDNTTTKVSIENCRNYGAVYSMNTTATGYAAGGIVGGTYRQKYTVLQGCINFGAVNSTTGAGGLVGNVSTALGRNVYLNFTESINYGEVTATVHAGGLIAGSVENHANNSPMMRITVDNCASLGNVTAGTYAGGILGRALCRVTALTVHATAVLGDVTANGDGGTYAGLISGYIWVPSKGAAAVRIYGSLATGNVTAVTKGALAGYSAAYTTELGSTYLLSSLDLVGGGTKPEATPAAWETADLLNGTVLSALNTYASKNGYMPWIKGNNHPIPFVMKKLDGAKIIPGEEMSLTFYLKADLFDTLPTDVAVVDGQGNAWSGTLVNGYYEFTLTGISAADFGRTEGYALRISVKDKVYTATAFTEYSVYSYAARMYGKEESPTELKNVLIAMMQYADAAQTFRDGGSTTFADFAAATGYTGGAYGDYEKVLAHDTGKYTYDALAGDIARMSAELDNGIALRLTLNEESGYTDVAVAIGDCAIATTRDGNVVTLEGLNPADLYNEITFTFTGEGKTDVVATYSLMQFLEDYTDTAYETLAHAAAIYMEAVWAYAVYTNAFVTPASAQ